MSAVAAQLTAEAASLDEADALAPFREKFNLPRSEHDTTFLYFNGNSLGLQPRETRTAICDELECWGMQKTSTKRVGWAEVEERRQIMETELSAMAAEIVGAKAHEVAHMNGLTTNLHLMFNAFYHPTSSRFRIVMEQDAFCSDQYAIASQCRMRGIDPDRAVVTVGPRPGTTTVEPQDIIAAIQKEGERLALVFFGGVHFSTGQLFDLAAITAAARAASPASVCGFDLAHAAGNVPLELHRWGVDFACWCTYKYLNAGPGGLGGIFVHERHLASGAGTDAHNAQPQVVRMAGWWGHESSTRFAMPSEFRPIANSAASFVPSNPPPPMMAALHTALLVHQEATMARITSKAAQLTAFLERAVLAIVNANVKHVEVLTPSAPWRGAQVSFRALTQKASMIQSKLSQMSVVVDVREPDILRVAPSPLYNSFTEAVLFAQALLTAIEAPPSKDGDLKSLVIESASKRTIEVACEQGDTIKFTFAFDSVNLTPAEVKALDIGFEASFVGRDYANFNQRRQVTKWARVKPKLWPHGLGGTYTAPEKGNLQLTFDNSYSWIKSKAIAYRCSLSSSATTTIKQPLVIAGPSGAGKGTLIEKLSKAFPGEFGFSVSHTTREPRPGEENGVHYHFTTRDAMLKEIEECKFIEHADVHGRLYGTSCSAVDDVAANNQICILDIDVQGVRSVKKSKLKPVYVFIEPPSMQVLEQRLRGRGTETEEQIQRRLANAKDELEYGSTPGNFDARIVNDDLSAAFFELVEQLRAHYPELPKLGQSGVSKTSE